MKNLNKKLLGATIALMMSGAATAGTVTWTGTVTASCSIDSDVAGSVVQVGTLADFIRPRRWRCGCAGHCYCQLRLKLSTYRHARSGCRRLCCHHG